MLADPPLELPLYVPAITANNNCCSYFLTLLPSKNNFFSCMLSITVLKAVRVIPFVEISLHYSESW